MKPGLHPDLDETMYRQDRSAVSQSDLKLILKSPAHFKWARDNRTENRKAAFEYGKAAHALVLGKGVELIVHEYDSGKVKAPKATKAWKEQLAGLGNDEVLLLPDEYARVQAMADQLSGHRLAMELLSEGRPEVSAYASDPATGVAIKGRFDWVTDDLVVDYKTAQSADPDVFVRKAIDYAYDLQSAMYLDLAALAGTPVRAFVHLVQESEPPFVVTVIVLPPELIDRGRELKAVALERYRDCVTADTWPGYLPDNEFGTPAAPSWALRKGLEAA